MNALCIDQTVDTALRCGCSLRFMSRWNCQGLPKMYRYSKIYMYRSNSRRSTKMYMYTRFIRVEQIYQRLAKMYMYSNDLYV